MTLVLRWRKPTPSVLTRWRGPDPMPDAVVWVDPLPIAAIIGPQGPAGPPGEVVQFTVGSAASTWIIPHGFGRRPLAQVYLSTGEAVIADVSVDTVNITVSFSSPQTGYVLAS